MNCPCITKVIENVDSAMELTLNKDQVRKLVFALECLTLNSDCSFTFRLDSLRFLDFILEQQKKYYPSGK